jgi:hypothetical protein
MNEFANWLQKALDRNVRMNIIRSRLKKRAQSRELSDKKIAKELQSWSGKNLDKKSGLNIIDKPVSKNDFVNPDRSLTT